MQKTKKIVPVSVAAAAETKSDTFTGDRDGTTLIDKVVINNFIVTSITNPDVLVNKGYLKRDGDGRNGCYAKVNGDDKGVSFNRLDIRVDGDDTELPGAPFSRFFFGMSDKGYVHGRLELEVDHGDGTYNLFGRTPDELIDQIQACKDYLEMMDIYVDFSAAHYKDMEINRTVTTDLAFADPQFQAIGREIFDSFPGQRRLRTLSAFRTRKQDPTTFNATSIGRNGKGLMVKLYDKSYALLKKRGIKTDKQCTRFEVTIKGGEKIRRAFGTDSVYAITEDMIDTYYTNWIAENIIQPQEKRIKESLVKLRKMIKTLFRASSHTWADKLIQSILDEEAKTLTPLILDTQEIMDAIDSLDMAEFKDRNRKRRMKAAMRKALDDPHTDLAIGKRSMQAWNEFVALLATPYVSEDDKGAEADPEEDADVSVCTAESEHDIEAEKPDGQGDAEGYEAEFENECGLVVNKADENNDDLDSIRTDCYENDDGCKEENDNGMTI